MGPRAVRSIPSLVAARTSQLAAKTDLHVAPPSVRRVGSRGGERWPRGHRQKFRRHRRHVAHRRRPRLRTLQHLVVENGTSPPGQAAVARRGSLPKRAVGARDAGRVAAAGVAAAFGASSGAGRGGPGVLVHNRQRSRSDLLVHMDAAARRLCDHATRLRRRRRRMRRLGAGGIPDNGGKLCHPVSVRGLRRTPRGARAKRQGEQRQARERVAHATAGGTRSRPASFIGMAAPATSA